MARRSEDTSAEIGDCKKLIEWFEQGCKPLDQQRLGVEHEKPTVQLSDNSPTQYHPGQNRHGISSLLSAIAQRDGWTLNSESGNPVDLRKDGVTISLEPSGFVEHGGKPLLNAHDTAKETGALISRTAEIAKDLGIGLIATAYHPTGSDANMPRVPRQRFDILRAFYSKKNFDHASDLMACTATAQVNMDYTSEQDMVKKLRVGLALQPIAVALFANSPFKQGKPSGYQSYRSHIIHNNLGGRYGFMMPVAFEPDFGFEKFTNYVLQEMPMLGLYKGDTFLDARNGKFGDFIEGKLDAVPGQRATMSDWTNHLNMIWPEVRLRKSLEMRGTDVGPQEMISALPAFWAGLLYDKDALNAASQVISEWTNEDREYLRGATPRTGLETPFMGRTVHALAKEVLDISLGGLKNRGILNEDGHDERVHLEPLREIVDSGWNWAQRLLDNYEKVWNGDINRIFTEMNFENNPSVLRGYSSSHVMNSAPAEGRSVQRAVLKVG